jgi:hypothetical protein
VHAAMTEDIHSWGRCAGCGRPWQPWAGGLGDVATTMGEAIRKVLGGVGQMAGARTKGCSCDNCGHAARDCSCRCCVSDADLLIYTRLGERRVIPVHVENTRRRERDVEVSLSSFTTSGGKPLDIQGQLLPPTSFTLGPCEEREVTMLLAVTEAPEEAGKEDKPSRASDLEERRKPPDVDECLVGYADLSITGCNLRPVRIATAILPRDCASYSVGCGCGCC